MTSPTVNIPPALFPFVSDRESMKVEIGEILEFWLKIFSRSVLPSEAGDCPSEDRGNRENFCLITESDGLNKMQDK